MHAIARLIRNRCAINRSPVNFYMVKSAAATTFWEEPKRNYSLQLLPGFGDVFVT